MINSNACFAYFNKIRGIPQVQMYFESMAPLLQSVRDIHIQLGIVK
jgi:hypothetical protein